MAQKDVANAVEQKQVPQRISVAPVSMLAVILLAHVDSGLTIQLVLMSLY